MKPGGPGPGPGPDASEDGISRFEVRGWARPSGTIADRPAWQTPSQGPSHLAADLTGRVRSPPRLNRIHPF